MLKCLNKDNYENHYIIGIYNICGSTDIISSYALTVAIRKIRETMFPVQFLPGPGDHIAVIHRPAPCLCGYHHPIKEEVFCLGDYNSGWNSYRLAHNRVNT